MMVAIAHREWPGVGQRLVGISVFLIATRFGFLLAPTRWNNACLVLLQTVLLLPLILLNRMVSHLPVLGIALCCAALGLQNGTVTTAHGVSLHSTFVSGDFTTLLKPVRSSEISAIAARALLLWLVVGFATGALAAAMSLLLCPGVIFHLLLACFWLAFMGQALTTSTRTSFSPGVTSS